MKPCYRRQDEIYLLAHVIKEGRNFQQPCKALISPGNSPTVTRATGEFLRRCGWLASEAAPSEEGGDIATADSPDSCKGTAQVVHCKLLVGSCQLSTVLHVVEDVDFSDQCALSTWHIHVGSKDLEVLQCNGWDMDICYLSADHELCRFGSPPNCPFSCESFTAALCNGHPDCLTHWHTVKVLHTIHFMHSRGGPICQSDPGPYYCSDAAAMPTAEALLYLHDVVGTPWDASTCAAAAKAASVECLSYAHASGCPWDSKTCAAAAGAGSIDCLSYAHASGCPWDSETCVAAARVGSINCLSYAHASGCPWDSMTCAWAAAHGNLDCLVYAHEYGCEWDTLVLHHAARNGQLECLKKRVQDGTPKG
ncbi:hypothetical protein COCOBI_12-4440 [Coccomyxa sp. Obi]|nr:hypothetical protein COCOBI_12-4440 [Coccomyxa sp. Obi]